MVNFKHITLFCILSVLTFVASKTMAAAPSSDLSISTLPAFELSKKIERIYQKSIVAAGSIDQMDKRAIVLYHLYNDSNKQFSFALSISHLTLAIERSTSTPRFSNILNLLKLQEMAMAWTQWGQGLKEINQQMVQRLHFAYFVSKLIHNNEVSIEDIRNATRRNTSITQVHQFLNDTIELYPHLALIHRGEVEFWNKKDIALAFARWEHQKIIQARIEKLYENMPSFIQFAVRNVPDTGIEFFLKGLQIRTTLGLKCLSPFQSLRTSDFIDSASRIKQASAFHDLLAHNSYDPENKCFKDPYYTSKFPKQFHDNPEQFSRWYYDLITKDKKDIFANSTERWLQKNYRDLPIVEIAAMPSLSIEISPDYQRLLEMDREPLVRNLEINQSYLDLSQKLMSCLGFRRERPFANWYHYAYWASQSARKVISGDFFIEQDIAIKIGTNLATFFGLFQKPTMQAIFARTNNLIAMEMLPLGHEFYQMFCVQSQKDFSKFSQKLKNKNDRDISLIQAFHHYFLAMREENLKKKKEHVALATTLQVISEQIRIDDNINEAFRYNGSVPLAEYMFHSLATKVGSLDLHYGQKESKKRLFLRSGRLGSGQYSRNIKEIFNGDQMHLGYDVRTAPTDRDLLNITLPKYRELLRKYDLAIDVREIHKYQKTGVANWANLNHRLRHLIAQFRSNMSNPNLFETALQLQ